MVSASKDQVAVCRGHPFCLILCGNGSLLTGYFVVVLFLQRLRPLHVAVGNVVLI